MPEERFGISSLVMDILVLPQFGMFDLVRRIFGVAQFGVAIWYMFHPSRTLDIYESLCVCTLYVLGIEVVPRDA